MYQTAYADIIEAGAQASRSREREALDRSSALLSAAKISGFRTLRGVEAIFYTNRVWAFMVEDLSLGDNQLPDGLRANLISVGIHVIRRLSALRAGEVEAADEIIEISTIIRDGLQ
jgi:flagellar biosynthesis activator protein FlaF